MYRLLVIVAVGAGLVRADLPDKILFIGNSYTFFNGGVHNRLISMAAAAEPSERIREGHVFHGGFTLENHWNNNETDGAIDSIRTGHYDMVVLQGYFSTRYVRDRFLIYSRLFDEVIDSVGAQTVFYMTWCNPLNSTLSNFEIAHIYDSMAVELGAEVVHVGLGINTFLQTHTEDELFCDLSFHTYLNGTYLAAGCFYAFLTGRSPVGIDYNPDPSILTPADILELQTIADQTEGPGVGIAPVSFQLPDPDADQTRVKRYDCTGRAVPDAGALPPGIYFTGSGRSVGKVLIAR